MGAAQAIVVSQSLGFPGWLRLSHYLNLLFMVFLVRSGTEILMSHPRLYWNDGCTPGSEWLKFTRKKVPTGPDVPVADRTFSILRPRKSDDLIREEDFVQSVADARVRR